MWSTAPFIGDDEPNKVCVLQHSLLIVVALRVDEEAPRGSVLRTLTLLCFLLLVAPIYFRTFGCIVSFYMFLCFP
jgi:hypothetical protein